MSYINGQAVNYPSVDIQVNDQATVTQAAAPTVGLLLIGPANDGAPNTPLTFTNASQAVRALGSGDLLQGIVNAFAPSGDVPGVNQLTAIQVNPLTQATSSIPATGTGPAVDLTTTHYGTPANTAQWMLEAGSVLGYKFSQRMTVLAAGNTPYPTITQDDIGINAISLYYSGTGTTPTITITDSALTLTATTSDEGGTVTLGSTVSLSQVVAAINAFPGWNATLTATNPNQTTAGFFDNVSSVTVPTSSTSPLVVTAHVYALAQYFAANPVYFTGTRPANATALTTASTWTTASGATNTVATNTNWSDAYTTAQGLTNLGVVVPISSSESIWAMNDAHCHYMASVNQPRRGYVGDALGATISTETTDAAELNSNRTSIAWPGLKGTDVNGNATTFAPYVSSAPVLGSMRAAAAPTVSLTNKTVYGTGLEQTVSPATVATGNTGGVIVLRVNEAGSLVITHDQTTWLQTTAPDKVENMTGLLVDLITQDFHAVLQPFLGVPLDSTTVGAAAMELYHRALYWYKQGALAVAPQASDFALSGSNGVISGTAALTVVTPTNNVDLTINLQPTLAAA